MKSDEKWLYFVNFKSKKSSVASRELSIERPHGYEKKTLFCIWWDKNSVIYYKLLKPWGTVNSEHYRKQKIDLKQVLLKNDQDIKKSITNWFCFMIMHTHIQQNLSRTQREAIFTYAAFSLDLAPSGYYLLETMGDKLAQKPSTSHEVAFINSRRKKYVKMENVLNKIFAIIFIQLFCICIFYAKILISYVHTLYFGISPSSSWSR